MEDATRWGGLGPECSEAGLFKPRIARQAQQPAPRATSMDDIYKAAVRNWDGWAHWGLTHLRMGQGARSPQRSGGYPEEDPHTFSPGLQGGSGSRVPGVDGVQGLEKTCQSGWRRKLHLLASRLSLSPSVCSLGHGLSAISLCICVSGLWIFAFLSLFSSVCSKLSLSVCHCLPVATHVSAPYILLFTHSQFPSPLQPVGPLEVL